MIRELMLQEAGLALDAYDSGDLARYELHRANARRLSDHLALQAAQEQRPTVYRLDRPLAPGVVEGPDHAPDFLLQEDAQPSPLRSYGIPLLAIVLVSGALGYFGRLAGWL